MSEISEEQLLVNFDALVSENVIIYGSFESIKIEDEGYPMEFRICPAFLTKPHTVGAANPTFAKSRRWGPGSDMYCPDERLILTQLNKTHDLAFNLFCADRPQLLMLTLDSFRRQHEALDLDDLAVMLEVLKLFPSMYTIYNCGEKGGCSRVHKHQQALVGPPYAFNSLIQAQEKNDKAKIPYRYFARQFTQGFNNTSPSDLLTVYTDLLGQCRQVLSLNDEDLCPHNVAMWDSWLIMIPRQAGFTDGASANTGGILGSVWMSERSGVDDWLKIGCANVLSRLGVPSR